jgi:hypothetical protein
MNKLTSMRTAQWVAGALLSLFAALSRAATFPALPSFETISTWLSTRDYMVLGAAALVVAVVAAALAFWFVRRRRHSDVAHGPDMRWWRNS